MSRETVYTAISILLVLCLIWVYFVLVDLARKPTAAFKWRVRFLLFLFMLPALSDAFNLGKFYLPLGIWMGFAQVLILLGVFFFCLTTGTAYLGFQLSRAIRTLWALRKPAPLAPPLAGLTIAPVAAAAGGETTDLVAEPRVSETGVIRDAVAPTNVLEVATVQTVSTVETPDGGGAPADAKSDGVELSRRRWLRNACYGFGGVTALTGVGALWTEAIGLQVNRITITCPRLPPAFRGYRIVQLSDVHAGVYMGVESMRVAREAAEALDADLIVLTGDQVDRTSLELIPFYNAFEGMRGKDGVYSILGNHDYVSGGRIVHKSLNAHGFPVLYNEQVRLVRGAQSIVVAGLDDLWHGIEGSDPVKAFAQSRPEDFRICLAHNPNCWPACAAAGADLTLSGHTHGGQINMVADCFSPARLFSPYVQGLFRNQYQQQLFVSVGVGFVGIPVRIGVPAEIVEITLA